MHRENKDFFARYDFDNEVRAPTADACHVAALAMLKRLGSGYKWARYIEVQMAGEGDCSHSSAVEHELHRVEVTLIVRRMERAPKLDDPGGPAHVERSFAEDLKGVHQKKARAENTDIRHVWERGDHIIPYTDEAWNALLAIEQAFRDAREKVNVILGKKNLPALLAGMMKRPLLTVGGTDE